MALDPIHVIAQLPKQRLLETLAVIDLPTLRRFHEYYGLHDDDPDSGDLLPIDAHAIMRARLWPKAFRERRQPRHRTLVMTTAKKAGIMAERAARPNGGEGLRHPGDLLCTANPVDEFIKRNVIWMGQPQHPGQRGWTGKAIPLEAEPDGPVTPEQLRLVRAVQRAERAA